MFEFSNLKVNDVTSHSIQEGDFVTAKNGLGLGKVVEVLEGFTMVEYFDSPAEHNRHQERIVTSRLARASLKKQMRVYYFDEQEGCWRIGRVDAEIDRTVYIDLPHKESEAKPIEDVFVRWLKPIDNPWALLSEQLTDTPYFHARRHELVRQFINQRSASMGMTGLISSSIDIEAHQVDVVRRVLSDPVQRYLLADEVGLGKTIEAGVIARQHVLDNPDDHQVLIVVPCSLVGQWESEMESRCQLGGAYGHNIQIVSIEEVVWYMEKQPTFVIVDEAHQLTKNLNRGGQQLQNEAYEKVKALSLPQVCSGLLLLSATPALRNEEGFLALLHLLDPLMHDLDDVEAFKLRVKNRQNLADIFWSFTEDQDPMFLQGDVEQLRGLFPLDKTLLQFLDKLEPMLDFSGTQDGVEMAMVIGQIRMHLSETQRLHRRILRTRRCEDLLPVLPGRGKLFPIPYENERFLLAEAELEKWRINATISLLNNKDQDKHLNFSRIYQVLMNALWGDIQAFLLCLEIRKNLDDAILEKDVNYGSLLDSECVRTLLSVAHYNDEESILNAILESKKLIGESRDIFLNTANKWIPLLLKNIPRLVVMTSSPAIAQDLYQLLHLNHSEIVTLHNVKDEDWLSRWDRGGDQILICDQTAEEGLNLQGGNCGMVHLDLPLSPNRIEQRLGRLDRFGSGSKIDSVALLVKSSPLSEAWTSHLNEVWKIFNLSIASLQYLVDAEIAKLSLAVFEEGAEAIIQASQLLIETQAIQNEKNAIRNQDSLDSIEDSLKAIEKERLEGIDDVSKSNFSQAVHDWMAGNLLFDVIADDEKNKDVIRYRYRYNDRKQTLIATDDFLYWFRDAIDKKSKHPDYLKPLTHAMAYSRQKACREKIGVARLGHPVVESIRRHIRWDDRGSSFAMWRHLPISGVVGALNLIFFRLDFVVEANRNGLQKLADSSDSNFYSLEREADLYFPPIVETIWVDESLTIPDERWLNLLNKPYRSFDDSNIRPQMWPELMKTISCDDWVGLCDSVRNVSEGLLTEMHQIKQKSQVGVDSISDRYNSVNTQLESRIHFMADDRQEEKDRLYSELEETNLIREAIIESVINPTIRLDSSGVVILSNQSNELGE